MKLGARNPGVLSTRRARPVIAASSRRTEWPGLVQSPRGWLVWDNWVVMAILLLAVSVVAIGKGIRGS